ncbi:hypothetical protein FQR65_LT01537 [Abscondita terminalis]|nr:hypothetical protein FQR65_LT01537 [Abscondita terminalis]
MRSSLLINSDVQIKDVRDIWGSSKEDKDKAPIEHKQYQDNNKYKTLERHLSMKKTIRKKMMRDLKEIGDSTSDNTNQCEGFLEQIRTDQPPPASIDKPSLWKRLTKGWGHS